MSFLPCNDGHCAGKIDAAMRQEPVLSLKFILFFISSNKNVLGVISKTVHQIKLTYHQFLSLQAQKNIVSLRKIDGSI